jgi:regulator of sigma E protease
MDIIFDIFYFIVVIAILVVVHELGHFLAARMTGMRADVFSVGMGNRLFGYNKVNGFTFGKLSDKVILDGNTDYRVCAFPIGGYVKILGMVDESMDDSFAKSEPKPYEFRSKNSFQKAFVLSAGVLMNFLLALFIFAGIFYFQGDTSYKTTTIGYVAEDGIGKIAGLQHGDKILRINNNEILSWNDVIAKLTTDDFAKDKKIELIRNNEKVTLNVSGAEIIKHIADQGSLGLDPIDTKTVLISIIDNNPAQKAGLKAFDTILAVNNEPILSYSQFIDIVEKNPNNEISVKYKRDEFYSTINVTPNSSGKIGVGITQVYTGNFINVEYGLIESVEKGFQQTVSTVELFFTSIGQIFTGNLSFQQSVGGPIMIASKATEHAEQGIISFLSFMALLSISLAIINILPFPALDGGHLVFVIVEGVIRKEVPHKVKMAIQQGGVIILLLFMLFVVFVDINRLF